ncbi:hypothetical protein B0X31_01545 [Helicobacter pylori]|nr:hypothetical protein B0X31_01545 [Helicobacter pylori]
MIPLQPPFLKSPHNPLRTPYEKLSLTQAFLFWLSKHPKAFFRFHNQLNYRANILKPYKDQ